ncbi:MAG: thiamine phosphate synthase [Bryobacteraceae bacterium]
MTLPRLYPILDTESLARVGCPLETAARATLEGGARILQLRHKGHWPRELFTEAVRIRQMARDAAATFVVNDRADFAALLDAGLHAGQDDLSPSNARRVIGVRPLGFSTHNEAQLRAAASLPCDYLALGPIFSTGSKRNPGPLVGVERLHQWRRLTMRPLVAIGGITREHARAVWDAGADSVAVIGDLLVEPYSFEALRRRIEEWLKLAA